MPWISFDGEMDGPVVGLHSMISFGAVVVEDGLKRTFYREMCPISTMWVADALAVSGFTRQQCQKFMKPGEAMDEFKEWLKEVSGEKRPIFVADNPLDFAFVHHYFHIFTGSNPFGWSGRRIGDLYCGMKMDTQAQWKYLRKTSHTHNALDDAIGNAEAILAMRDMGLKIKLK